MSTGFAIATFVTAVTIIVQLLRGAPFGPTVILCLGALLLFGTLFGARRADGRDREAIPARRRSRDRRVTFDAPQPLPVRAPPVSPVASAPRPERPTAAPPFAPAAANASGEHAGREWQDWAA